MIKEIIKKVKILKRDEAGKNAKWLLAIVFGSSLALASCTSSNNSSSSSNNSGTQAISANTKVTNPVPLVVYSAQGYDSTCTKAFQGATGIPVSLDDDSTGPLLTKIQAEKSNPQWGVLWVDGDQAFAALDQENYLVKGFEPGASLNQAGQSVVPSDKSYIPTGLTIAGALVYNPALVPNPPTDLAGLRQISGQVKVGMNNPSISGPTYPFVAGVLNATGGVANGENYFQSLKSKGLVISDTNDVTLNLVETGQIAIALVQSSAAIGATIKHPDLKVAFLNPSTPIPSVIGIDSKVSSKEQTEAKIFASWVLTSEGQSCMQTGDPKGDSLYWPVVNGTSPLSALPPFSSVPYKAIDPYKWGSQEGTINTWFTSNIVQ